MSCDIDVREEYNQVMEMSIRSSNEIYKDFDAGKDVELKLALS